MKIGITYNSNKDVWETGANSCSLHISKMLSSLGYETVLITLAYEGVKELDSYNFKYINDINKDSDKVDVLIDIDGLVRPMVRKRIADRTIVFVRGFVQFSELDKSVYPESGLWRSFDGVSEVWVWDVLNPEESLDCLRDLYGCPIRRIPYIWDPCHHILSNSKDVYDSTNNSKKDITIRIMEKNTDNTSSSTLLMSGLPELKMAIQSEREVEYICHTSSDIWNNEFFKVNVLQNIHHDKIPVRRENRLSYNQLISEKDIVLTHTRFSGFRPGILDLVWLRIPFVHNSPILRDLCEAFATGYYPNNSVSGMIKAVKRIMGHLQNGSWLSIAGKMATAINCWGILENEQKWRQVLSDLLGSPSTISPIIHQIKQEVKQEVKQQITIGFSDMWPGFNYDSNFLIDALRNEVKDTYSVKGVDYWCDNNCNKEVINCIIFGPYTDKWRSIDSKIPKIFFSAENWGTKDDPDNTVKLSIVPYRKSDKSNTFYLPTWMTFLKWFTESSNLPSGKECEDNPIRFPIHFATRVHPIEFSKRKEFCGFVVSNPVCSMRNNTYKAVNEYKRVNSGGSLYNNIGGQLTLKYPGGGCGDISKYHFLEQHKFQLCFENSQANGYVTEKLLHSKIAGCVPIYWGDPDASSDFLGDGFLNVSDCQKPAEVLDKIKELEQDKGLCLKMSQTPLLDFTGVQKGYQLISDMSKRILSICGIQIKEKEQGQEYGFPGVDKVVVINLDRRRDRWESWITANPILATKAQRFSAVDGKLVKLDSEIYKIFKHNSFKWKKAMVGCTLSHMGVWQQLLDEPDDNSRYLILEDDMRFGLDGWEALWQKMMPEIPKDADVLYIGGVLPTNKKALPSVLEMVNDCWAKIRPNSLFTGSSVELPIFHFCAYSYILTKSGAKKLLEWLQFSREKCFTCDDHLIGDPRVGLNKYVSVPLITKCFQEEDDAYLNSDFNTVDRADTFDSDIWNSIDNFSQEELVPFKDIGDGPVDSMKDLLAMVSKEFCGSNSNSKQIIYYLKDYKKDNSKEYSIYEAKWLTEILGEYEFKEFDGYETFVSGSWIQVMRPHSDKVEYICKQLDKKGIDFRVLHLSDEFCTDLTNYYLLGHCKKVVRNYLRGGFTESKKVVTIPLGYHQSCNGGKDKGFSERELVWSFCGTSWFNRKDSLDKFSQFTPNRLVLLDKWEGEGAIQEKEYLEILRKSKFCPILRGNNWETFRLYECLENGVIPLIIRDESGGDEEFWNWIREKLCLVELKGIDKAVGAVEYFLKNPDKAEAYRIGLMDKWIKWKEDIKDIIKDIN